MLDLMKSECPTLPAVVQFGASTVVMGEVVTSSFRHHWKYEPIELRTEVAQSLADAEQFEKAAPVYAYWAPTLQADQTFTFEPENTTMSFVSQLASAFVFEVPTPGEFTVTTDPPYTKVDPVE